MKNPRFWHTLQTLPSRFAYWGRGASDFDLL